MADKRDERELVDLYSRDTFLTTLHEILDMRAIS